MDKAKKIKKQGKENWQEEENKKEEEEEEEEEEKEDKKKRPSFINKHVSQSTSPR